MRVPAAYNVLPDRDAPRDAEEKRGWLEDIDTAIREIEEHVVHYTCNALPRHLTYLYREALMAGTDGDYKNVGFDTDLWRKLYERYTEAVAAGASSCEARHPMLVEYRVSALKRFRNIVRRTLPLSKRKGGKHV